MPAASRDAETRAQWLFKQGKLRAALAVLTVGVCRDSSDGRLWLMRAIVNHSQGDWEAALADIETAMTLTPLPFGGQLILGDCYLEAGKTDLAVTAYEHLLRGEAKPPKVYAGLYRGFRKCGRDDLALEACRLAREADPSDHAACFAMAHCMASLGHAADQVAAVLEEAARVDPTNDTYRVSLAMQLVRCDRRDEAYTELVKASVEKLEQLTCLCSARRLLQLCDQRDDRDRCEAICRSISRLKYYANGEEPLQEGGEFHG